MRDQGVIKITLLLVATSALGGCFTNNLLETRLASVRGPSSNDGSNVGTSPDGGSASLINLTRVVKNAQDPTATFDLIGDGSGTIGQFCIASGTGTGTQGANTGPTSCSCSFQYTKPDGTQESFESPTTYYENNLVRCKYTDIPAAVSKVDVQIHLTNSDSFSNKVSVTLTGTGLSLDLSNPSSFVLSKRYQCRDIVYIPNAMDGRVYDPIQSEDIHLSYPLNFYTTNMGGTFSLYASSPNSFQWNCPPIPNDSAAGLDLKIYSVGPDSTGSKQIYPTPGAGGGFDRSTFHLARNASGVFNVPLNSYIAPAMPTAVGGVAGTTNPPPIGYGAAPIPSGAGQESCPDSSVTIPAGYHWVKVWLFRADLPARTYVTPGSPSTGVVSLNGINCNPGLWTVAPAAGTSVFQDCSIASESLSSGANPRLADRILGTSMCVTLRGPHAPCSAEGGRAVGSNGPGCTTATVPGLAQFGGVYQNYALGTDVWGTKAGGGAFPFSCGGGSARDPMSLCSAPNALGDAVPYDVNLARQDLDQGRPRFDFLFVVTPPSVMASTMRDTATTANYPYTPYRFYTSSDCSSPDPDNPLTPGDCSPVRKIRYGLKLHDIATNGDPPGTDPNRAGVFPLCALQPN